MNKTISGKYVMDPTGWDDVSVKAKDFVKNLLQVNPKERLTADQAQKHPWIVETKTAQADPEMFQAVVQKLPDYAQALPMKKLALLLVAHSSSSEDVSQLRKVFDQYDADDSGEISFEEFRAAMRSYSDNREDLRHLFDELDVYGNGRLSYTEFLAAALEAQHNVNEEQIAQAFDRMDEDDSGYISFANMRHLLGDTFSKEDVEKILNEVDTAKDGKSK
jgi:Ca2+-binding EF-hand superfamily protein